MVIITIKHCCVSIYSFVSLLNDLSLDGPCNRAGGPEINREKLIRLGK